MNRKSTLELMKPLTLDTIGVCLLPDQALMEVLAIQPAIAMPPQGALGGGTASNASLRGTAAMKGAGGSAIVDKGNLNPRIVRESTPHR